MYSCSPQISILTRPVPASMSLDACWLAGSMAQLDQRRSESGKMPQAQHMGSCFTDLSKLSNQLLWPQVGTQTLPKFCWGSYPASQCLTT